MSLRRGLLWIALFTAGCGKESSVEIEPAARPDVVIYLIDTLRADFLGPYGAATPTPNIERLAREGVVFEQASAPAPWTLPSVVSLMTSTFVVEHDVHVDGRQLSAELPTLAEELRAGGYVTLSFHRNPYAGALAGLERGFEHSKRLPAEHREHQLAPWLEALGTRPFFCYFHTVEPHDPFQQRVEDAAAFGEVSEEQRAAFQGAARRYRVLTRADFVAGEPLGTTDNSTGQALLLRELDRLRPAIAVLYTAAVVEADRRLGDFIAELERADRFDDALFMLVSDHGEEMGEHGGWMHDQSLYEELVHVPLVVRFPGGEFAGERVATPVSLVDVLPTVLGVVGAEGRVERARGRDLRALLTGEAQPEPRVVSMRRNAKKHYRPFREARGDLNVAVRDGMWKAIWNVELDTLELYDLATDPGETRDLAAAEPQRAERLRAVARDTLGIAQRERVEARLAAPDAVDADTRNALEDLGYVGGEDE